MIATMRFLSPSTDVTISLMSSRLMASEKEDHLKPIRRLPQISRLTRAWLMPRLVAKASNESLGCGGGARGAGEKEGWVSAIGR
jgi:hypothetical protein